MPVNIFGAEALVKAVIDDRLREAEQARLARRAARGRADEPGECDTPTRAWPRRPAARPTRPAPASRRVDAA